APLSSLSSSFIKNTVGVHPLPKNDGHRTSPIPAKEPPSRPSPPSPKNPKIAKIPKFNPKPLFLPFQVVMVMWVVDEGGCG
ncbi:hypothetical protein A2U01_0038086, partial [Trifolium medium]|nr:hypothetical protein [Trifolium medium]